jgi:hypothetical protein
MNDQTDHLDQADEDILTYTVSDDALEAAAGTEPDYTQHRSYYPALCC